MSSLRYRLRHGYYAISGRLLRTLPGRNRYTYFVCSYGGSGSKMLSRFLAGYGRTFHPHSPKPPPYLTVPILLPGFTEVNFVAEGEPLAADKCRLVYLFRDPVEVVISRYLYQHCVNMGGNCQELPESLAEFAAAGRDLFGFEQHFDNWVGSVASHRNYPICFLKYDEIWRHLPALFDFLELPIRAIRYFPRRKETSLRVQAETRVKLERMFERMKGKIREQPDIRIE